MADMAPTEFQGLLERLDRAAHAASAAVTAAAGKLSPLEKWFVSTRLDDVTAALNHLRLRIAGGARGPDPHAATFGLPTWQDMTPAQSVNKRGFWRWGHRKGSPRQKQSS